MRGIFDLASPPDLLAKLRREYKRFRGAPDDADHAFNFFVTAEHMLDWLHPGSSGEPRRRAVRTSDPLLETVSHLANGAKHFDRLKPHHKAVSDTTRRGGWFGRHYFAKGYFAREYFAEPTLVVKLSGAAAAKFGSSVTAIALAGHVLVYWSAPGRVQ